MSDKPYQLSELVDSLSYPADEPSLNSLKRLLASYHLGLPNVVRDHFLTHDGQDVFTQASTRSSAGGSPGIVWGLWLMSCEEVEAEWGFWRRFDGGLMPGDAFTATDFLSSYHFQQHSNSSSPSPDLSNHRPVDQSMSSCPAGWVREVYSNPAWLPLLSDRVGNYIGVDLRPPVHPTYSLDSSDHSSINSPTLGGGQGHACPEPGQVIAFGREIDEKVVLWRGNGRDGWANWLASFADDLEDGKFARLIGKPSKRSSTHRNSARRNSDGEPGWDHSDGDDDDDDPEDGLGELGYFDDGSSFTNGVEDGDFFGWRLAPEYRGMSVIEALCARSKQRWAEVGSHSSRRGSSRFASRSHSEAASSRQSLSGQSQSTLIQAAGPSNSRGWTQDDSDPPTPIAFVTPPSPRPTDVELNAASQSSQSLASRYASSDGQKSTTTGLHPVPVGPSHRQHFKSPSNTPKRPRPPPPAPVSLDLPTMDSLMLEAAGYEAGSNPSKSHRSLSPASSVRSTVTPTPSSSSSSSSPTSSSINGIEALPNPVKTFTTKTPKLVGRLTEVTQQISEEMARRASPVSSTGSPVAGDVSEGGMGDEVIGMVTIPSHSDHGHHDRDEAHLNESNKAKVRATSTEDITHQPNGLGVMQAQT